MNKQVSEFLTSRGYTLVPQTETSHIVAPNCIAHWQKWLSTGKDRFVNIFECYGDTREMLWFEVRIWHDIDKAISATVWGFEAQDIIDNLEHIEVFVSVVLSDFKAFNGAISLGRKLRENV